MLVHESALVPLVEAVELTGLSYASLYGFGLRGHFRLRKIGGRVLVPVRDLEEFVAKRGASLGRGGRA